MNLTAAWRRYVTGPSGSELEQAALRASIALVVTLYVCWYASRRVGFIDEHDRIALTAQAVWLILAIGMFSAIWKWPSANVARRVLGILVDVGATTFWLFITGGAGAALVGMYPFITFDNGFRYGRLYLYVSQFLCLIGFVLVVSMVQWWQHELLVAVALMIWMIVLPVYVATLAERINVARMKAEEALEECIQRQRGDAA